MVKLNTLDWITMALIIIGGINWALIGIFRINIVAAVFGEMTVLARSVYILVGLSALYILFEVGRLAKRS